MASTTVMSSYYLWTDVSLDYLFSLFLSKVTMFERAIGVICFQVMLASLISS